ncbi:MAG: carboxypeptidase-like regulatory domain-containing protein, partial [Terracidiphilus sp.]
MAASRWTKSLAKAALLMFAAAGAAGFAQSGNSGSLAGRLTDLRSRPLAGATVWLRNETTGASAQATTSKSGTYRFTALTAGEYTLEAESLGQGRGQVDGIVVSAGHESHVQTAIELLPGSLPTPLSSAINTIGPTAAPRSHGLARQQSSPPSAHSFVTLTSDRSTPEAQASPLNDVLKPEPMQPFAMTAQALQWDGKPASVVAPSVQAEVAAIAPPGFGPKGAIVARPANNIAAVEVAVRAARIAMQLALAAGQAAVASPRINNQESSAPAGTVTAAQLQSLPVTGRDWQNFVLDSPAAAIQAQSGAQMALGVDSRSVTVDGANIRLAFGGSGVGRMSSRRASLIGPGASEASIRELQTAAGNEPSSGDRASANTASIETRRGTNALHGQASVFNRRNLWGAQNPFTQWVKETALPTLTTVPAFTPTPYTPSDRETTWDFGIGGQIRRNKLFWFAAVDSFERNDPGISTVKHPDNFFVQPANDQMQVLSARLGLSSANPVAAGVAAYSNMLETLGGLLGPAPRTSAQWTGFGRVDWAAAERHHFTLEGTGAQLDAPGGGLTSTSETYGSHSYGSSRAGEQWLLGRWEAFLTPNLLAVTQGSVGRSVMQSPPESPSAYEQTLNINEWGQLPQIVVDSRYGFTIGNPSRFGVGSYPDEHLYHVQEQLSWVRGALLVKAGVDMSHNTDATSMLRNQTGTYYYSSVENFASDALSFATFGLNGQLNPMDQHNCDQTGKVWRDSTGTLHGLGYLPCYSYYSQTMGPTNWWLSTNDLAGYVTAQWNPKKQLTLSLAMRWESELLPPPISLLKNPDLPLTETLPGLGNEFGPRVSLAWGSAKSR